VGGGGFENLLVHVRRSVVMMVAGVPKTEASAKDLPLDATLAESLLKLKVSSPYNRSTDWVFASTQMNGKEPLWPDSLWRKYGKPAVTEAKITKRVGFHTFRHTYTTLLTQNNENVKVVQELLRHANGRITRSVRASRNDRETGSTAQSGANGSREGNASGLKWTNGL
jgi:integrase